MSMALIEKKAFFNSLTLIGRVCIVVLDFGTKLLKDPASIRILLLALGQYL